MRNLLYLPLEIATAFLFAASIGIGAGVVATSYTHRLGDGLKMAVVAFLVAAGGFGYVIWRNYRPHRKPVVRRLQAAGMAAPR